jgi:crotonobetainyl-CoA:carnitine CoA-transferase CaiB-like acyl-CoA transferase
VNVLEGKNKEREISSADHRLIGQQLDLFSISEEVGSGLALWHPKGTMVRNLIRDYWEKRLIENNCMFGRTQTPTEVINDPQALANNFFFEIPHPIVGKMKLVSSPIKFHQNPATIETPAPELGQHNEEILLDLGYSWEDISAFKDAAAIG